MKALVLTMGLILAGSANATHFKCAEKGEAAIKAKRRQYAVWVTSTGKITDPDIVEEYDGAEYVRISVLSRNPKVAGSKFKLDRPSFEAVAKYADVMYDVDGPGIKMSVYLDEMDQTTVRLRGVGKLAMNCGSRSDD